MWSVLCFFQHEMSSTVPYAMQVTNRGSRPARKARTAVDTTLIPDVATGVEDFLLLRTNTNRYKALFLPSALSVFNENYTSH